MTYLPYALLIPCRRELSDLRYLNNYRKDIQNG
ncbi:hypothetical protein Mic7113_6667 (plasmid) [Allocoleopsis franciscana PCC 7113]|uniref:Uncharacterized protein n=1 Tax=Allocoleopsis franciscana PCC 7113 TaxID=1173027 RepID=K9WRQ7_9CYAN|nr:hypothetical protein Mic7113_6667 [Allocoleopsis franciscana PCC 7113]